MLAVLFGHERCIQKVTTPGKHHVITARVLE